MNANPARSRAANRPSRSRGFLLGMFVGLLLGLAIALAVAFYLNRTPVPFASKAPVAGAKDAPPPKTPPIAGLPQGGATADKPAPPPAPTAGEKPKFDFYRILPGSEEAVSDKELKERARLARAQPQAQPSAPGAGEIYFIQAGAFQNPADADNQKARLAILGFESNVEPANLPDRGTLYRVRLGPYTKVDEINRVRQQLAQNGIDANLVKMKDTKAN